jgi:hypothetical protein
MHVSKSQVTCVCIVSRGSRYHLMSFSRTLCLFEKIDKDPIGKRLALFSFLKTAFDPTFNMELKSVDISEIDPSFASNLAVSTHSDTIVIYIWCRHVLIVLFSTGD